MFILLKIRHIFRSEFFFRTTRELEYIFFCRAKCNFFFQNSTVGYMTKTLNQIIFFPPPKSEYFFFSNIGNQNIFLEKNHNPPPPPFKLNGRSLIGNIVNIVQHSHLYNSFLLIIVACIVILLVAILYRDHVGFCVIVTFSSIHKLKWPVLLSYLQADMG